MGTRTWARRPAITGTLLLGALLGSTTGTAAQTVRGLVAEQLSLAPVHGAAVVLYRIGDDEELIAVRRAMTDSTGAFALEAGPGRYRVQAEFEGTSSPLSQRLELSAGAEPPDLALVLPSSLLRDALTCGAEGGEGTAAIVGVVRDPEFDMPLPGAMVVATWRQGPITRRLETSSDTRGLYRLCPPGDAGDVTLRSYLLGEWVDQGRLEIEGPSMLVHDLVVGTPMVHGPAADPLRQRILREAEARGLGDVRGRVLDRETRAPLRAAEIGLTGKARMTVTDEAGRFALIGLDPDVYTLEVRSLGYEASSSPVTVEPGMEVVLELHVAPRAVEIEGLTVTARPAAIEAERSSPFRRDIVFGEGMAEEEARGAYALDILRRSSPGLRVTETNSEMGRMVCVSTNRRIMGLMEGGSPCAEVVWDGVRVPEGAFLLSFTPASMIESIEFITPVQAQILFGIGGRTSNGVVVVYTRGRGPWASPLRDVR
jgi:hypothetical protein